MATTPDAVAPRRTCVGCRTTRPQPQLVRLALTAGDLPIVSRTAAGRGAWLCAATVSHCGAQALKRRGFERAWKRQIDSATTRHLERTLGEFTEIGNAGCDVKTNMEH